MTALRKAHGPRPPHGGTDAVLARMRALGAALPPGDGVAVFNGVYLTVTQEIAALVAAGSFADREAAGDLAAYFAGRYLDAVRPSGRRGGARPPACWRALLRVRGSRRVRPLQFALAGINAHVGHDLALAVVDTCRAAGCRPDALRDDFDRVGAVLAGMEMRVREQLMPGPDALEAADPLTHLVGAWSLSRARDAAWAAARVLWALRGCDDAFGECAQRLDSGVALVGRLLLTPVGARPARIAAAAVRSAAVRQAARGAAACRAADGRPPLAQSSGSSTGAISS